MARRRRRRRRVAAESSLATAVAGKRPGRPSVLSRVSTRELQAEIERRQEEAGALLSQRDTIARQIDELDRLIADLGGTVSSGPGRHRRRRGRPPGSKNKAATAAAPKANGRRRRGGRISLADALHTALQGKTLSVSDAAVAVKQNGYPSNSPNLRTMVNQQLLANPGRFKRVSRGQYTAK